MGFFSCIFFVFCNSPLGFCFDPHPTPFGQIFQFVYSSPQSISFLFAFFRAVAHNVRRYIRSQQPLLLEVGDRGPCLSHARGNSNGGRSRCCSESCGGGSQTDRPGVVVVVGYLLFFLFYFSFFPFSYLIFFSFLSVFFLFF